MAGSPPVYIVFNPRSGKGRGERLVQPVLAAFAELRLPVEYARTTRAGDETSLTEAALARGFRFTPRLHVILWGDKRGV